MNGVDIRISLFENNLEMDKRLHNTSISRIRNKLHVLPQRLVCVTCQQCECGMLHGRVQVRALHRGYIWALSKCSKTYLS